jgi:small-conductance mechanosensitive channel
MLLAYNGFFNIIIKVFRIINYVIIDNQVFQTINNVLHIKKFIFEKLDSHLQYRFIIIIIIIFILIGCVSWDWYYPFHYAPFINEVMNFGDLNINFPPSTPFFPFEQLLAVLPPGLYLIF